MQTETINKHFEKLFQAQSFTLAEANIGAIDFVNDTYKLSFKYNNRHGHQFEGIMLYFNADPNIQANILDVLESQTGQNGYTFLKELTEKDIYGLAAHQIILEEQLKDFWTIDPVLTSATLSTFLSVKYPW